MRPTAATPSSTPSGGTLPRLVRAGVLTGVVDGLFASAVSIGFQHSTVERLFQGIAATVVGPPAFSGGAGTAGIGLLMHFGVAFGWSAVFLFLVAPSPRTRAVLATPYGRLKVASLYGPAVWLVMSLMVIPLLLQRPPRLGALWWIELVGHIPFVGLPIVASIAGAAPRRAGTG